eukprot:gene7926-12394_t
MKEEDKSLIIEVCDVSAVKECFKKHPRDRNIHCKKELAEYKTKCSEAAEKVKSK